MADHWWRAYDSSIDHPKLLRLSDAMHRAWFTLQCIASANGGDLPSSSDIALRLRMKPAKVCEWITHLVGAGLIDRDGDTFRPHNWDSRQYKTDTKDPTAALRAKNYRDRKRDAHRDDRDETVTHKRPDTEQITEQKEAEANASGAEAPPDPSEPERQLFRRGKEILGPSSGGQIAKLLKAAGGNVALARSKIELAATKENSAQFIAKVITTAGAGPPAKPLTQHQIERQESREILNDLKKFVDSNSGVGSDADLGLLRFDPSDGQESIHRGAGGNLVDLPARRG